MATFVHLDRLPDNILLDILSYLSVKDRCVSGRVCRRWRKVVADNSLWRHVDLLPYKLDLSRMWRMVRTHLSSCLRTLRVSGTPGRISKSGPVVPTKPALSESMLEELRERCPALSWLHMEPGNVSNLPGAAAVLPASLTHLTLRHTTWQPRWLKESGQRLSSLVYLDLCATVRVDDQDMTDVCELTALQTLKLDGCYRLKTQGLTGVVKTLTSLTSLSLRGVDTSDLLVHHAARHLTALTRLDLSGSKSLTPSGVTPLGGMGALEWLALDDCRQLSVAALSALSTSPSLRALSLVLTTPVTESDAAPWREKMSKCEISL